MSHWVKRASDEIDVEVLEESALAMAQSTIQNAINQAGISRADLARKMECNRSFISRMLSGNHNLTIKTMARSLAACGFEVRFEWVPIVWNWVNIPASSPEDALPANAGSTMPADSMTAGMVVPTLARWMGEGTPWLKQLLTSLLSPEWHDALN